MPDLNTAVQNSGQRSVGLTEAFQIALDHHVEGRLDIAADIYDDILKHQPDAEDVLHHRGLLAWQQQQPTQAIDYINKALQQAPKRTDFLNDLADIYQSVGHQDDAISFYTQALTIDHTLARSCHGLGSIHYTKKEDDSALKCLREAVSLDPTLAVAYNLLGSLYCKQNRMDLAIESFHSALQQDNTNKAYWFGLAQAIGQSRFNVVNTMLRRLAVECLQKDFIEHHSMAHACLSILESVESFQQLLAAVDKDQQTFSQALRGPALQDSLFLLLLQRVVLPNYKWEKLLTKTRHVLLLEVTKHGKAYDKSLLAFVCALAIQCFNNEYAYAESAHEHTLIVTLEAMIATALQGKADISALVALLACYRPLSKTDVVKNLKGLKVNAVFAVVVRQQVSQVLMEADFASTMPALNKIDDTVSQEVSEHYSENPYPRWQNISQTEPMLVPKLLKALFPKVSDTRLQGLEQPEILIAGCGSGRQALAASFRYANANITAIDLSLTSLAYAKRKTQALDVKNITYMHGDLLGLDVLNKQFDIIECCGVLHCLRDPEQGLQALLRRLKPNGWLKIALYSQAARRDIVKAREFVIENKFQPTANGIRDCRQAILQLSDETGIKHVSNYVDFYTLSNCRDLIFHAHEIRYDLLGIKVLLDNNTLDFMGFDMRGFSAHVAQYQQLFPEETTLSSLEHWAEYEKHYPDAFLGMYQFWVTRT